MDDILGEQNALELNQEEVSELFNVLQRGLRSFLGNSVVPARTERTGDALLQNELADKLDGGGHYTESLIAHPFGKWSRDQLTSQRHVQELEGPAEERQVAGGKDEADNTGVGHGGRARLLPLSTDVPLAGGLLKFGS